MSSQTNNLAAFPALYEERNVFYPKTNAFEMLIKNDTRVNERALGLKARHTGFREILAERAAAADAAANVVDHPVHKKLVQYINQIRMRTKPKAIQFNRRSIQDYARKINRAENADGWGALAQSEALFLAGAVEDSEGRPDSQIKQGLKTAIYVKSYLNAYFRGGRIFSVKISPDATDQLSNILQQNLVEELRSKLQALYDSAAGESVFKLGDAAFVSRGGGNRQFPGFSASIAPSGGRTNFSEIAVSDVGADVVRVTLEAFFDSVVGLPAVSNATGIGLEANIGGTMVPIGLPEYSELDESPYKKPFDEHAFEKVDQYANSIEGFVKPPLETALIGFSFFGTNNALLSNLIATAVAVSAKKAAEYTAWCYEYARAQNSSAPALASRSAEGGDTVVVESLPVDIDLGRGTTISTVTIGGF